MFYDILYNNFNNFLFESVFPSKLKEADITPVHKKEEKYLKKIIGQLVFYQIPLRYYQI